jgi:hypothetical protein
VRAASYVETAVAAHRSYLDGDRALELRSSSPELVTAWFADKVPFPFRLPNAQSTPNSTPAYRLAGAGLVNYRGNKAALVTYEKEGGKSAYWLRQARPHRWRAGTKYVSVT